MWGREGGGGEGEKEGGCRELVLMFPPPWAVENPQTFAWLLTS